MGLVVDYWEGGTRNGVGRERREMAYGFLQSILRCLRCCRRERRGRSGRSTSGS